MNNDIFQGKWSQMKGNVKTFFGKLTDDDLTSAEGNADKMIGLLQERYGYTKEKAQSEWNKFMRKHGNDVAAVQDNFGATIEHVKKIVKP
jgi:uncharacterized protein YjbJ (UPF0337 family)